MSYGSASRLLRRSFEISNERRDLSPVHMVEILNEADRRIANHSVIRELAKIAGMREVCCGRTDWIR